MALEFLPAPVVRRSGWERWAFIFFLIAAASSFSNAISNISFALCGAATILWRREAAGRGETILSPFSSGSAPWPGRWLGLFVALSVLSCFFSTSPARSLGELKGFITFALFPLALAFLNDADDVHLLLDLWRISALYLILRGLVELLSGAVSLDVRLSGGMSTYMTYSGLLMGLVLVLAARGTSGVRGRASCAADLLVAALGTAAVALTLTRSAYLGLAAGALALLFLIRPLFTLVVPVLAVMLLVAMPASVRTRAFSTFDAADRTARDRVLMWQAGASMVADHPLFGVGPGRVKELYPKYRRPGYVNAAPGHLHDNVVMIAAETGIPSALAYLAFTAMFLIESVRRERAWSGFGERSVARGCVAAMAAFFVSGFFEYNFGDVEILRVTLVMAALPLALPFSRRTSIANAA
ncbi:MAG: O-antigen ligase family protein [Thermoanaerobaculia bacterium]